MLIPRKCVNVSPQCPVGQERGYRLGWYQGQIDMADEHDGTPCQVIGFEQEIERLKGLVGLSAPLCDECGEPAVMAEGGIGWCFECRIQKEG